MIRITEKMLRDMGACQEGINWFLSHKARSIKTLIPALLKDNHADYANWLIVRLMTHPQKVAFAIYAAEQVIKLFEKRYPSDDRPRKAIQAAKDFLIGKTTAAYANAAYAAANAIANVVYANAAYANAAYANAAYAAANAAATAAYAAYAAYAASAAAYAADAAACAANAANTTSAVTKKILDYGLNLLGEL